MSNVVKIYFAFALQTFGSKNKKMVGVYVQKGLYRAVLING